MTIERRSIPPAERAAEIAQLWAQGATLSELVLKFRYSPTTIALDLLTALYPDQADKKRAYAAFQGIKFGLFGYEDPPTPGAR